MAPHFNCGDEKHCGKRRQEDGVRDYPEKLAANECSDNRPHSHHEHERSVAAKNREALVLTVAGKANQHRRQANGKRQTARELNIPTKQQDKRRDRKLAPCDAHERCHGINDEAGNDAGDKLRFARQESLGGVRIVAEQEHDCDHHEQSGNDLVQVFGPEPCRPACPDPSAEQASGSSSAE